MSEIIGWTLICVYLPLIFLTFPIVLYGHYLAGWRNWPVEKSQRLASWHRRFIHIFMMCVFLYVAAFLLPGIKPLGIVFLLVMGWLVLPIKHPSDYRNYASWWADRKNWHKGAW